MSEEGVQLGLMPVGREGRVAAQTLLQESGSTSVRRKLGFERTFEVEPEDDGRVREWRLPRGATG